MTEVTLGEFSFDPVEPSDFRIAFEGASKTGKSNSLAVLLEDLAEVNLPTLVVERLGILSTVRTVDENMIVVGGRDEPGIDLAVPLESIEVVADMVLERGLKVILDVSTYEADDPDAHPEHRAAARVLKALNEDAAARLRAGSRRKCLVLVDEVHVLAPERGAPHIDLDDDVRRARAQLVTIATEGGNKGINFVAAYQRRAYTSKGVVSQMDNHVIHRLHRTDRAEAAREIGVDEDEIADLGTGEIFAYGDVTEQRVVGPTTVRLRDSPDPRDGGFDLPEPPDELADVVDAIADEVEDVQEKAEERADRIAELEDEIERLRERNEDLEEQVRTANVIEKLATGGDADVDDEVLARIEDLQERNAELVDVRERLEDELETARERIAEQDDRIEELETELSEYRELDVVRDEIVSNARSILRQLGAVDLSAEDAREELDDLRDERDELRDEVEDLRERLDAEAARPTPTPEDDVETYVEFLDVEAVQERIEAAKDETDVVAKAVRGVIRTIVEEGGAVDYSTIADRLGYSGTSHVSSAASALAERDVVEKEKRGNATYVDLALDEADHIRKLEARRRRADEVVSDL